MGRRNPNGYGCVTKLSGQRSKPWIARVTVYDETGASRQIPVGYAETEAAANIILAQYNNNPWDVDRDRVTLAALYQRWADVKLPKLGASNQQGLKAAFKYCSKYNGMKYRSLRSYHMQDCIDSCERSYSTKANIKSLFGHLDKFAFEIDLIDKMYSQLIVSDPVPETVRTPFTEEQIGALWEAKDQPYVDTALIYLYTGFRLNELLSVKTEDVDLNEWTIKGGLKTAAGKDRIIPIHERIRPFIKARCDEGHAYLISSSNGKKMSHKQYYAHWGSVMDLIGAAGKTPHEARHTFETNLDNAKGNRKCIDMLMGHKSKDVGNRVYNHKTLEQLRETIDLLK